MKTFKNLFGHGKDNKVAITKFLSEEDYQSNLENWSKYMSKKITKHPEHHLLYLLIRQKDVLNAYPPFVNKKKIYNNFLFQGKYRHQSLYYALQGLRRQLATENLHWTALNYKTANWNIRSAGIQLKADQYKFRLYYGKSELKFVEDELFFGNVMVYHGEIYFKLNEALVRHLFQQIDELLKQLKHIMKQDEKDCVVFS